MRHRERNVFSAAGDGIDRECQGIETSGLGSFVKGAGQLAANLGIPPQMGSTLVAVIVVSFGSTLGATAAMLLGRTLFRESVVNRLGPRGETLLKAFEHNGAFFLFTLRMMPQVPFVLVNLVMSVSTIRARTFFWVSQLGMLPATCLYVFTGSQLPSLVAITQGEVGVILTWPLILGLVMLGCFPLLVKLCWPKGTAQWDESGESEGESEGEAGS